MTLTVVRLLNLFFIWTFALVNALMLFWFCEGYRGFFSLGSILIFTLVFNKICIPGHQKEMHRLYASMCQSLILHLKGTGVYLEKIIKMLALNFTLLKYIFSPFLTLVSCHNIVTGDNRQAKSSFLFNVFYLKSQNKNCLWLF